MFYFSYASRILSTGQWPLLSFPSVSYYYSYIPGISILDAEIAMVTGLPLLKVNNYLALVALATVPLIYLVFRRVFLRHNRGLELAAAATFGFFLFKYQSAYFQLHAYQLGMPLVIMTILAAYRLEDRRFTLIFYLGLLATSFTSNYMMLLLFLWLPIYFVTSKRSHISQLLVAAVVFVAVKALVVLPSLGYYISSWTSFLSTLFEGSSAGGVVAAPLAAQNILDKALIVGGYLIVAAFVTVGLFRFLRGRTEFLEFSLRPFAITLPFTFALVVLFTPSYLVGSEFSYAWYALAAWPFLFSAPFLALGMGELTKFHGRRILIVLAMAAMFTALLTSSYPPASRVFPPPSAPPSSVPLASNTFFYTANWDSKFSVAPSIQPMTGDAPITELVQALTYDPYLFKSTNGLYQSAREPLLVFKLLPIEGSNATFQTVFTTGTTVVYETSQS